jgi:hypothetical protein
MEMLSKYNFIEEDNFMGSSYLSAAIELYSAASACVEAGQTHCRKAVSALDIKESQRRTKIVSTTASAFGNSCTAKR